MTHSNIQSGILAEARDDKIVREDEPKYSGNNIDILCVFELLIPPN
ncbi:MAG: hypothetical protein ACSHXK_05340 [Oceanococcus sp.]